MSSSTGRARVFVLAGQSNMVGRPTPDSLPPECAALVASGAASNVCVRWDCDRNFGEPHGTTPEAASAEAGGASPCPAGFVPLQPQVSPGRGNALHYGPEMAFAAALRDPSAAGMGTGTVPPVTAATDRVYLIKFAMGSTKLATHWLPNADVAAAAAPNAGNAAAPESYFEAFVAFCTDALARICAHEATLARPTDALAAVDAVLWLQGESDSGAAKTASAYEANLTRFITALRTRLTAPGPDDTALAPPPSCHMPLVVLGEVVWHGKHVAKVNAAIRGVAGALPGCAAVPAPPSDAVFADGHLNGAAVSAVGRGMAAAYLALAADARQ